MGSLQNVTSKGTPLQRACTPTDKVITTGVRWCDSCYPTLQNAQQRARLTVHCSTPTGANWVKHPANRSRNGVVMNQKGDFTAELRLVWISSLAIGIGALCAVVAWLLQRLIFLFTNLFYYQELSFTHHHNLWQRV